MLQPLSKNTIGQLLEQLQQISKEDESFFHPHPFTKEILEEVIKKKGDFYFLFYNNTHFIGYSFLRTFNKYPIPTYGGIIWEQYRGQGYGSKMLQETLEKAKELGFLSVKLKVYKTNTRAFSLYKKQGFEVIGEEGEQLWMEKQLV